MASIAEQIQAAQQSARAALGVEQANRSDIDQAFEDWDAGKITNRQIRHRLENIVRGSYRASGAIAREHTRQASELEDWTPAQQTFRTDYLNDLLADVRRNLREYGTVKRRTTATQADLDKARRRALLRIQHSAGVATSRGYTDALIAAHDELERLGFQIVKVWAANFVGNTPCKYCRALHGTHRGLHETFSAYVAGETGLGVYRDLQGPPRHPQCQCHLIMIIITLENAAEPIDIDTPDADPDDSATSEGIRNLPLAVFAAIIAALRAVIRFATGR